MDPSDLRESPAGSGESDAGDWREGRPGLDDEGKAVQSEPSGATEMSPKNTCRHDVGGDKPTKVGEQLHSPYDDELDPRIQEELEHLNEASAEINKLELELDTLLINTIIPFIATMKPESLRRMLIVWMCWSASRRPPLQNPILRSTSVESNLLSCAASLVQDARSGYRKILTESARKLNAHSSQLGSCIEKARPYYEARRLAKEAQQETQKAALSYERAVSMHTAAREMVYVAEQGLMADGKNTLDPTWQEMLNHATSKVNEAEEERLRSEREHMRVTHACQEAEARVQTLQKSLRRAILKSKPYFELKAQFNHILEEHKTKVVELEQHVSKVKTRYSIALRNLEQISEQIHAQRGRDTPVPGGRSTPVGAESDAYKEGRACGGAGPPPSAQPDPDKERERAGSDSVSVFSLQTIASDLEKYDSIEHLGDLSDAGSVTGEEDQNRAVERREKLSHISARQRQQEFSKQHHRSFSL